MSSSHLNRRAFLLHVDLDPVPGAFHTPRSAYETIQYILDFHLPSYGPVAILGRAHPGEHAQDCDRKRICFAIFVDLDTLPGPMYSQESAQNVLRYIFTNRIPDYHPIVSPAPADIQPENIARGVRA